MKEMKQDSSTIAWNAMGDEWFELARTGDARNYFIMPNMLRFMGDVTGKRILDLGCGEGGYSRALAKKGASLVSVDCSRRAIEYAVSLADEEGLSIEHYIRNSNDLFDIASEEFDIVLCSMMLMDCEDFEGTLREAYRVLEPGGRLFASVLHPCFDGNHEMIWRHRTLEEYVKAFIAAGFTIADMNEPRANDELAQISVAMAWLGKIPLYLYWELKK